MSLPPSDAPPDPEPPRPPRAVLDTSVLLSQHRHWLWLLAYQGFYEGVWSTFIVGELVRIRVEHSIARSVDRSVYRQRINDLIHALSGILRVADYRLVPPSGALRDPDDEPILATAIAGHAEIIVSLNTRDFPAGGRLGTVLFLTPTDFLADLNRRYPDDKLDERAIPQKRLP